MADVASDQIENRSSRTWEDALCLFFADLQEIILEFEFHEMAKRGLAGFNGDVIEV